MSGTSLDGLDIAQVLFQKEKSTNRWNFEILAAITRNYPDDFKLKLKNVIDLRPEQIDMLDKEFGIYIGNAIYSFQKTLNRNTDFIASHGHTVFHQPNIGITKQIGDAHQINKITGIPVINNFREADVLSGGQGAPLVPIGDRDLFAEYDMALNLGGIANISFDLNTERIAFDICPFNLALNELASYLGYEFDEDGLLSKRGNEDSVLLRQLDAIDYLKKKFPKSLGLEDYRRFWQPLLSESLISTEDKMTTYIKHAAVQIAKVINENSGKKILITGGGAYNSHFINKLQKLTEAELEVPENQLLEFKEALVFAYLGLLKFEGKPNCLSSVTGALTDVSGGDLTGF